MRTENLQTPTIGASAEVVLTRKPDVAFVTVFLSTDGILLEDAVKESARKTDEIQKTLRDTYRDIRDIQVTNLFMGEAKPDFRATKPTRPTPRSTRVF